MTTYRDIEDSVLYQGGCLIEEYDACRLCGGDVYDDGRRIDGEWYCDDCFQKRQRFMYARAVEQFGRFTSSFDLAAMADALKEFEEDYIDEYLSD